MQDLTKANIDQNITQNKKPNEIEALTSQNPQFGDHKIGSKVNEYSDPDVEEEDEEESSYEEEDNDDEQLLSIDYNNLNNPLKLAKYAERIFSEATKHESISPLTQDAFFSLQTEITPQIRETGGKWLIKLQEAMCSSNDTLFNASTYLNIVLTKLKISSERFQLFVVTCFWISSKMEERNPTKIEDLCQICKDRSGAPRYTPDDFLTCEKDIITALSFHLNYPTSKFFLRRYLDVIDANDDITEAANFFNDISILRIEFIDFSPTTIALSAVCLGKLTLKDYCPTARLMHYAKRTDIQTIKMCTSLMLNWASTYLKKSEQILVERYSAPGLLDVISRLNTSPDVLNHLNL